MASQVTLGGRQVTVPRLRVRSADGEESLPSFRWAATTDPLDEHTLAAVAAGVSTRRYAGTLDPAPAEVTERGTSSSAVSRRFVALSAKRLRSFLSRPLGELDLRVVCIDGHLPERLHASVGKALRDAWDLASADRAARVLKRLAGSLERDHPGAAASIREGLEETLTVQRLGLTGSLERTLRTTNIIENLMGSVEGYTRRVKRWRGGQMIQRRVASALVEAEPRFRRVRGYRDLRYLVGALDALAPPDGAVADVA